MLKILDRNWVSFFKSIKVWTKNRDKFLGKPKLPKYKTKNGEFILVFTNQQVKLKDNILIFPKKVGLEVKTRLSEKTEIREVRIIPKGVALIVEIVYKKKKCVKPLNKTSILAIDLETCNLITAVNNKGFKPFVVKGGVIKSINQYYNKEKARIQSVYDRKGLKIGKTMQRLIEKRNKKINNHFHKYSKKIY